MGLGARALQAISRVKARTLKQKATRLCWQRRKND
jgi:hypothetical protein